MQRCPISKVKYNLLIKGKILAKTFKNLSKASKIKIHFSWVKVKIIERRNKNLKD